ncbi:linalool dehydratase-isomerase precursor [Colletotrichum chrysophilum]|uniref:Linalool dehydratase-isomerase n=1 Tax=Colletotrichum chrysophilum TaxID=1836956 RepID=A0AAD9APA6_9PEZI|nr:linalool dehydratase-isomerase precursor [Colletotrichum chrysophilum]
MAPSTMTTTTETTKTNGVNHLDAAELPSKIAPSSKWVDTSDSIKADPSTSVKASDGPVGDFGWGPWKIQDVLIPPSAGRGMIKKYHQRRTLYQYTFLSLAGLWSFHNLESTSYRAAALGFLFPGAGFTAVASPTAVAAFLLTLVLIPVSIFVWFAMGGIAFPIALWIGSSFMAGRLAQDTLFEQSAALWALGCFSGITWLMNNASSLNAAGYSKAQERNKYLVQAVEEQMADAAPAPQSGDRELSLETLRHVQHMIERGLSPRDDFSFHDVIDQFQTGAIRYQLYGTIDALSLYQCHYVPGFHGYLSKACQNAIEKSLQKRIMSYWKWESIFGRFTLSDWDPIKKDNIMVTGYLSAAIGLYGQASGDRQYNKKDALEFVIDDGKHYKTNYEGLADALFNNMTENPYCLYPCEPNWTYSLCNLTGMAGLVISDRLLGRDLGVKLRNRFERSLEEEFTECDGRILPIRSEFTGLTLPGLCGTLTDCINAMLLTAYLPHLAHRNWAMIRKEFLKYDKNGQLEVRNLKGADKMDPGNYRASEGPLRAFIAATAAEFGNEKIRKEALNQLDNTYFPVEATKSGSLRNKGLSATSQVIALMARLVKNRDLANATLHGPPENALKGPLLEEASFPDVLVAKAYSNDGKQLDLVLYNGAEPGTFELGFERLVPGKEYSLSTGGSVKANNKGKATVKVSVKGRTQIILKPVV